MEKAKECPLLMSNSNPFLSVSHSDAITAAVYGWRRLSKMKKTLRPCTAISKKYLLGGHAIRNYLWTRGQ